MCHLYLTSECELRRVCLRACVCVSVRVCVPPCHICCEATSDSPLYAFSCSNTSTHRSDRTRRKSRAVRAHSGVFAYWDWARVRPLFGHARVCVAVTECLFRAWGYNRAGAAKVLWFCPWTQVNLPRLVLRLSTWWLWRTSPRTFWP